MSLRRGQRRVVTASFRLSRDDSCVTKLSGGDDYGVRSSVTLAAWHRERKAPIRACQVRNRYRPIQLDMLSDLERVERQVACSIDIGSTPPGVGMDPLTGAFCDRALCSWEQEVDSPLTDRLLVPGRPATFPDDRGGLAVGDDGLGRGACPVLQCHHKE